MSYTLQFGQIWPYLPYLAAGALVSLWLAFLAFMGGMVLGLFGAMAKTFGPYWLQRAVNGYVVFFTNTPQLVQIYFLYFALPDAGILLSSYQAVLVGMTLNAGAYSPRSSARASSRSIDRSWRFADTLGMSRLQSTVMSSCRISCEPCSRRCPTRLRCLDLVISCFSLHCSTS